MPAKALMLCGTGSSVGKSVLVAGLARACRRRGIRVAPFKPQNMSNNAAVVAGGGGEIGRAQALQARAAGLLPTVHMNPVLLKPQNEVGAQVVVQGQVFGTARASEYQALKPRLLPFVLESFTAMRAEAELVLVEGAGSASETNLRAGDIANLGFARATETPVVVVGDIDRGGVIAALVGTHAVLDEADRAAIRGFIVNRMRGDLSLFSEGIETIVARTGWASMGLVPNCGEVARLPAEDAADLRAGGSGGRVRVAVPLLPGIANFDDLDPLRTEPDVDLVLLGRGQALPGDCALVVLPGSKTTISDLQVMRDEEWDVDIRAHWRRGGRVLGLCGGYQMLGRTLSDPAGIEGLAAIVPGLGLLDVDTVLSSDKQLAPREGVLVRDKAAVRGYEMHLGRTEGPDTDRPFLTLTGGQPEGAVSACGRVAGTYLHGLFGSDPARAALLREVGATPADRCHETEVDAALDAWADHLEQHVDVAGLLAIAG